MLLPDEVLASIVACMEPASVLALCCASKAASEYLSQEKYRQCRQGAKEAIVAVLRFIRLEHEYDWDEYGITDLEAREEVESVGDDEGEQDEPSATLWLPGPRTQGCDSLAALFRCTKLTLMGRGGSGPRGYQPQPRGCHKTITLGGFGRDPYGFDGLFEMPSGLCSALPCLTELDLEHNKISVLPSEFASLCSLKKLNLSCNSFEVIPSALSALSALEILKMQWSFRLRDLAGLSPLVRLVELTVEPRELSDPHGLQVFQWLVRLRSLHIAATRLRHLPPSLAMPASLVDLSMDVGTGRPPNAMLKSCVVLESLRLNGAFDLLPAQYSLLTSLTSLDLSGLGLVELPDSFGALHSLQHLDVGRNHLRGLPDVHRLRSLRTCRMGGQSLQRAASQDADDARFKTLREQFGVWLAESAARLPCVVSLDLSSDVNHTSADHPHPQCLLKVLPAALFSHSTLTRLDCTSCGITRLGIAAFSGQLQRLSLGQNRISALPEEIGTLHSLIQLDLHANLLVQLPVALGCLGALRVLNLARNQLCALPSTIGQLIDLRALQVDHNRLTALPGLHAMSRLKVLVACVNQLASVDAICNATSLIVLVLHNNSIKELPTAFARLTQLIWLDLDQNPIATVRTAVANMSLPCAEHVRVDPHIERLLRQNGSRFLRVRPRPSTYTPGDARVFHGEDEAGLRGDGHVLTWALFH